MTNMKKIIAVMICCLMIFALAVTSADGTENNGTNETQTTENVLDAGIYNGHSTSIRIEKNIAITNSDTQVSAVYGPSIEYSYTISPAAIGSELTVTNDNNTVYVLPGIADAVNNTAKINFTSSEVSLSAGMGSITGYGTLTFDVSKFSKPGVYRYAITDTTSAQELYDAGILRANDYRNEYYLDVYVAYKADSTTGTKELEIQGYSFFGSNSSIDASTTKSNGFEHGSAASIGTAPEAVHGDVYPTFNVEVTQTVAGTMPDPEHKFPISVTVTNTSSGTHVAFYDGPSIESLSAETNGSVQTSLKSGETLYLIGLNAHATVTASETNDTQSNYSVSVKNREEDLADKVTLAQDQTQTMQEALHLTEWSQPAEGAAPSSSVTLLSKNTLITFINELNSISPTGIIRYVTPYALMLMFAFFFILIMKNRRKEAAEE